MKTILFTVIIAALFLSCTQKPSTSKPAQTVKRDSPPAKAPLPPSYVNVVNKTESVPDIAGSYKAVALEGESEPCNLTITIKKISNKYVYTLTLPGKVHSGRVTISKSDDPKQFTCMLTLEGIQWASYEGDISQENDEHPAKEMELPVGITMGLMNNELTFQNNGNAMNAYTVLQECDQKYVRLVKQ